MRVSDLHSVLTLSMNPSSNPKPRLTSPLNHDMPLQHTPAPAVGRHGGALHQDDRGAPAEGRHIPPDGLGRKITRLPTTLEGIHSLHSGLTPASPATCCSGHLHTRNDLRSIMRQILWIIYTKYTIVPANA
jgi:hypothetical protein